MSTAPPSGSSPGNSTVTNLNAARRRKDRGRRRQDRHRHVANGKTVVTGDSQYTVTVTGSYSTTVTTSDANALSTSFIRPQRLRHLLRRVHLLRHQRLRRQRAPLGIWVHRPRGGLSAVLAVAVCGVGKRGAKKAASEPRGTSRVCPSAAAAAMLFRSAAPSGAAALRRPGGDLPLSQSRRPPAPTRRGGGRQTALPAKRYGRRRPAPSCAGLRTQPGAFLPGPPGRRRADRPSPAGSSPPPLKSHS
jgi:hypothetical protein